MSLVVRKFDVANVYDNHFFEEFSAEVSDQLLAAIDTSQETIRAGTLYFDFNPFHPSKNGLFVKYKRVEQRTGYTQYTPSESLKNLDPAQETTQILRKELEADHLAFKANQIEIVRRFIFDKAKEKWSKLSQEMADTVQKVGPIAFIDSELEVKLEVVQSDGTQRLFEQKFKFVVSQKLIQTESLAQIDDTP